MILNKLKEKKHVKWNIYIIREILINRGGIVVYYKLKNHQKFDQKLKTARNSRRPSSCRWEKRDILHSCFLRSLSFVCYRRVRHVGSHSSQIDRPKYYFNWCSHHHTTFEEKNIPHLENLLKPSGTLTRVLSRLKIPLINMRVEDIVPRLQPPSILSPPTAQIGL